MKHDPHRSTVSWLLACAASATWCALAVATATAQPAEPPPPPPQPAPQAIDPAALAQAKQRLGAGDELRGRGDCASAVTEYERAYALLAGHPQQFRALLNVADCYETLFRYDKALEYYRRYLDEGGANAGHRAEAEQRIAALEQRLATLVVRSNVPARVWVNGHFVGDAPGELMLPAGTLDVEVRAAGYEPEAFGIQLAARDRYTRTVTLSKLSDITGTSPTLFWASAAVTGVAVATGAVLGGIALHKDAELDEKLNDDVEALRADPRDDAQIQDLALAADVAFGAAALFGATTLILAFLTDWEDSDAERPASATARVRLTGDASLRSAGACLSGTF
jgi:tetratricopeptide (TPR) repeat protein